jgi:hypothetical protein
MIRRTFVFLTLLGAATTAPYLASNSPSVLGKVTDAWDKLRSRSADGAGGATALRGTLAQERSADGTVAIPKGPTDPKDLPLEGLPVYELPDVLRFDVTPNWVYDRWSRKSTALSELDLFGVRVPLVTGTKMDDLAGSLTYYFNSKGAAQRITFRGRTGDTRKIIALLASRFGFRVERPIVAGEQLYQVRWNGKPMSQLRIRPASVVWASAPHASFELELDLQRPGSPRYLADPNPGIKLPHTQPDLPRPQ